MAADLTSMDAALKETWTESRLAEQLYQDNPFLARVKRVKSTQVGQQAVTPIHVGRNFGYTALPAGGGSLNAAGQQGMAQATWQYTHHHQQVKIQGSAIDGTRGDALSVAEVVDTEISGALTDLNRQLTRQVMMDGDGLVAKCGTTTASTTVALDPVSGFNAIERGWLAVGAQVDIGTAANPVAIASGVTVTAVVESSTAPTITVSGSAVTTSASHFVSFKGARVAAGGASLETNGLGNIVSTSATLGGLTVAAQPTWASPSVDSTVQALTLPLMYSANRKIMQKTGKGATYVLTSLKQQQAFYQLVQGQARFSGDAGMAVGNVDGVSFNGMTVYAQPDTKNEDMFFLTIEDLLLVSAGDPYWQNKITGGNILTWIQGEDSFGGKITTRLNFGARRRNSHTALRGLS